ncbi:SPOR domain-containing protein [Saccharicrinis sp. FJH62]|uniref:SPOR domain-containing protein n=1 Tax=Saccharicrinis sp. FJH62 TaxID=3344657 RepID=UPI0035D4048A
MKKTGVLMFIIAVVISFTQALTAQDKVTKPVDAEFFTIQIKALSKEVPTSFFKGLEGVWSKKNDDGLYKYYYGRYPNYQAARTAIEDIRKKGYPDAFVVSSRKIIKNKVWQNVVEEKSTEKKTETKVNKSSVIKGEVVVYTIQLSAFKYPVYKDFFAPLTGIMEFQLEDKLFRYCIGKYLTKDEAEVALEKYKKMGYDKSFVVEYDKYEPYAIE